MASINYLPETPVVVTGGASGIGKACAESLAEVGRPIAIWDLDEAAASQVAEEITARFSVPAIGLGVDVTDRAAVDQAVLRCRDALGKLGGLVHSAGLNLNAPLAKLTLEQWEKSIAVNLTAAVFVLQAMLDELIGSPGAAVVGISSVNAHFGHRMNPAYSATKGGMLAVFRSLADDLAHHGIRINAVSPGPTATPLLLKSCEYDPDLFAAFQRHILLGRLGEPEEIAATVRFLMSDQASYVTAAELIVDGGNISSQRY